MKINLGCGTNYVDGYENLDKSPNVWLSRFSFLKKVLFFLKLIDSNQMKTWNPNIIYKDIRRMNYPEKYVTHIYSSHTLEHIYYWEAQKVIKDCYLMLKPGGKIRLALPDLDAFIDKYVLSRKETPTSAALEFDTELLSYPLNKPSYNQYLINIFFNHVHKWHPTKAVVIEMLRENGFIEICEKPFRSGDFPDLEKLENRNDFTFFVEATK
jgi:predicted SAM-dependent methyltransferase